MGKIQLNTASIYYEVHGEGRPLVLIPGYSCDHSIWQELIKPLISDFKIIIFDNRGSGQTEDRNDDFSIETLADDIYALIEALGLKNPNILGHSMGGSIALTVGVKYAQKIGKLMIVNSSAKFSPISSKALHSILDLQQKKIDLDLLLDCFMPWGFSNEFIADTAKVMAYKNNVKAYPYQQTVEGNARQLKALDAFDCRSSINKITAQTLVIGTEHDHLVSKEETTFIAEQIATSKLKILPGGHVMLIEQPEVYAKIILEFFKG